MLEKPSVDTVVSETFAGVESISFSTGCESTTCAGVEVALVSVSSLVLSSLG